MPVPLHSWHARRVHNNNVSQIAFLDSDFCWQTYQAQHNAAAAACGLKLAIVVWMLPPTHTRNCPVLCADAGI